MTASLDSRIAAPAVGIRRPSVAPGPQAATVGIINPDDPLQRALLTINSRGEHTPCFGDDRFTSEIRAVRLMARLECRSCPVFAECRARGKHEKDWVWGGEDRTPRDNRKRDRT